MVLVLATTAAVLLGATAPALQEKPNPAAPTNPPQATPPAPPNPPAPQERPPPSKALEELLRRLSEARGQPSTPPPAPGETPKAPQEHVDPSLLVALLTRTSDTVQVALASGKLRELAYWDRRLDLGADDEVRQTAKACTLLDYPDGAHFTVVGAATWRMTSDAHVSPRRFAVTALTRTVEFDFGRSDVDAVVALPGAVELAGRHSLVTVRDRDGRALEIRNSGPEPVVLRSPHLGEKLLELPAGKLVFLPVLAEPAAFVPHLTHDASVFDDARGRLVVQAGDEVRLTAAGDAVALEDVGVVKSVARACGARVVLEPGQSLKLTRAPLGTPRDKEREE
jgi:hypothetical protein